MTSKDGRELMGLTLGPASRFAAEAILLLPQRIVRWQGAVPISMSTRRAYRRMVRLTTGGRRDEIVDECGREPTAKQRGLSTLAFPRRLQLQRPRSIDVWQYSLTGLRARGLRRRLRRRTTAFQADGSSRRRTQFESLSRPLPSQASTRQGFVGSERPPVGRHTDCRRVRFFLGLPIGCGLTVL